MASCLHQTLAKAVPHVKTGSSVWRKPSLTSVQTACRHRQRLYRQATDEDCVPSVSEQHGQGVGPNWMHVAVCAAALTSLVHPEAAAALQVEPANALSLPTWAIHVSSVAEWAIAMALMWKYADVSGNQRWKGMTWGMLPALGSALSACTWHWFYNSPDLEFLVGLQAFLTVVSNVTCCIAAYRIWEGAKAEASS